MAAIGEHEVIGILVVLLLLVRIKAAFEQRRFMETALENQQAAIELVSPLRQQVALSAADILECRRRIGQLEDALARFTAGYDRIELDYKRRGVMPPWSPRDKDKFYPGRGRDYYV